MTDGGSERIKHVACGVGELGLLNAAVVDNAGFATLEDAVCVLFLEDPQEVDNF